MNEIIRAQRVVLKVMFDLRHAVVAEFIGEYGVLHFRVENLGIGNAVVAAALRHLTQTDLHGVLLW